MATKGNNKKSLKVNDELESIKNELKETKDFLNSIFCGTPDHALIITDSDGRILTCNNGFENLFGYRSSEINGDLKISDIVCNPQDKECIDFNKYKDILSNEPTYFKELTGIKKIGVKFPVKVTISLKDKYDKNSGAIIVINDNTDQRKMQQNLFRAQKMVNIGTLTSGIAHDFNNILTGIIGNISLLKMKINENESIYTILNSMEEVSERAAQLIKRMLSFARNGKELSNLEYLNVSTITMGVVEILSKTIDKKIKITNYFQEELWSISGNWAQIEQVVMNLLVNAKDAIENNGTINIRCKNVLINSTVKDTYEKVPAGYYVELSIKDTGTGIRKEDMDRIFEPFYTTKDPEKGTGLGLSMVNRIVKDHNGYIFLESEEKMGTEVVTFFPAVLKPNRAKKKDQLKISYKGKGTILVVDDEEFLRRLLNDLLIELNYEVILASNGIEAVEIFKNKKEKIDLVILDVIMPELNGEETYYELKKIEKNVKVLFSSGYSGDLIDYRDFQSDPIEFISKPYSLNDISKKIKTILNDCGV